MSEWEGVRLDEVIALDVDAVPVTATTSYDIVGVLNRGRGLLFREPITGSETSYKTLNRIRPNQIVYSRLKAFEGAITVAPNDLGEVYASQEFPTFTCGERMLPEYFRLLTTTKQLWEQLQALSTGMGGRRERVKPADFLTMELALPSLSEQRRIVDVVVAVDALVQRLAIETVAAEMALKATRDSLLTAMNGPEVPLKMLTTKIGSGATPRGGEAAYAIEGVSLIRSQNVYDGRFEWNGLAKILDDQARLLDNVALESSDVLINITGASVNRVAIVPDEALPARVNQHVAILRCNRDVLEPSYLAHVLRRSDLKAALDVMSGSGTTRQALTKAQLETFSIPSSPVDEQRAVATVLDGFLSESAAAHSELAQLRAFRSALLTSLLNQEIEIPESYDALLEEVS
ncbi:restriction endonuclease subunit S [Streptomyces sp. NPDC060064]|uniref:restriction endonuclease subunit S n=1 Tax=Streptomyces sp. NPDC060064 TaxID=3347049 RepID=UPI0036CB2E67